MNAFTELAREKVTIISGPYGSGKTNVAVNLAMEIAKSGETCRIADLDIVNPYFRSADNGCQVWRVVGINRGWNGNDMKTCFLQISTV